MAANNIPDTTAYLYFGLATIALVMGLFIISLYVRARTLRAALSALEQEPPR